MKKVITECYRVGSTLKYRQLRRGKHVTNNDVCDDENTNRRSRPPAAVNQGMRRPYIERGRNKSFGENLSPLYRFLGKQVGRSWDAVWAEVCQGLDSGKVIDQHVKEHVLMDVKVNVTTEGGVLKAPHPYAGLVELFPGQLYVCPKTGKLARTPLERRPQKTKVAENAGTEIARYLKGKRFWIEYQKKNFYRVHLDEETGITVYNIARAEHVESSLYLNLSPFEKARVYHLLTTLEKTPFIKEFLRNLSVFVGR